MRIFSQDGMIDVPYESNAVKMCKTMNENFLIMCISNSGDLASHVMAEYSTEAKARKAMEMLQNTYYDSELSKFSNDGTAFLTTHFQFPQESEI